MITASQHLYAEIVACSGGAAKVRLPRLWDAFAKVLGTSFPGNRRQTLHDLIDVAIAQGNLVVPGPSAAGWDRGATPALPPYVTIVRAKASSVARVMRHPWSPQLAFLEDAPSGTGQAEWLKIDAWLKVSTKLKTAVPKRERSWEIFGDEKLLDSAVFNRKAFTSGRLDGMKLLKCFDTPEPLAPSVCAEAHGRPLLVVENTAAFSSLSAWNREAGEWSAVVYGRGSSFATSWTQLHDIAKEVATGDVLYVGDIDGNGFEIPARLAVSIRQAGLTFEACEWLYHGMLDVASGLESPTSNPWKLSDAGRAWISRDLAEDVSALGKASLRVPQECYGTTALLSRPHWGKYPSNFQ